MPTPTRQGYSFLGWYLGTTRITNANLSQITESCTLTARWTNATGTTYTIVYKGNGGQGIMLSQVCSVDEPVTLRDNAFIKEGYSFRGWGLPNGSLGVTIYQAGSTVVNLGEPGSTVTLYAQWGEADDIEPPIVGPPIVTTSLPRSAAVSSTTTYGYDAANRLLSSTTDNETKTYTYDDNGNLLTELDASNTAVVNHSYDGLNADEYISREKLTENFQIAPMQKRRFVLKYHGTK